MGVRSGVVIMGVFVGATSFSATAATFEVPRNFEIMYVDLENSGNLGGDFKTEINAGEHQLVVRYNDRIGGGADADRFQSEPIIIDLTVAQDDAIELKAPHFFRSNDAAKFADNPEFSIINKDTGAELSYEVHMLPAKSGSQMFRNYRDEIREFTQTYKTSAVTAQAANSQSSETQPLEMLKFWYNRASKEEQEAFQEWLPNAQ